MATLQTSEPIEISITEALAQSYRRLPASPPQAYGTFFEKPQIAYLYTTRFLLRQLRNCGCVWSDRRSVCIGAELTASHSEMLDWIVILKERNPTNGARQ